MNTEIKVGDLFYEFKDDITKFYFIYHITDNGKYARYIFYIFSKNNLIHKKDNNDDVRNVDIFQALIKNGTIKRGKK